MHGREEIVGVCLPPPLWLCGNMCPPCVMWSVNIEPFLRWWRLRDPRRHHGGAMKEWQWCTQTVHSALWEKNTANSFTSFPLTNNSKFTFVFQWFVFLLMMMMGYLVSVLRLYCNVQFRLSPDQYLSVAWLWAGARRMCTLYTCTVNHVTRMASCHTRASIATACHPGLCTASLSQAVTARPGGRGRSRDLSRVTCHAVTWRHTVTAAGLSRGSASE